MDVLVVLAAAVAIELLYEGAKYLIRLWGEKQTMPEQVKTDMSEKDQEMIKKTKEVIAQNFGDSVLDKIASASNLERIDLIADFANDLAKAYGLDVEIDITIDEVYRCGYYDPEANKMVFNILAIAKVDKDNEHFAYFVRETLDTIIHEMRHAVQVRAIREEGFWDVDEARRAAWANNIENYIRAEVDRRAYALQPIEADASTFANEAMEGVC